MHPRKLGDAGIPGNALSKQRTLPLSAEVGAAATPLRGPVVIGKASMVGAD
jgi:hypothetical protein